MKKSPEKTKISQNKTELEPKKNGINVLFGYSFLLILVIQTIVTLAGYYKPGLLYVHNLDIVLSIVLGITGLCFLYLNKQRFVSIEENITFDDENKINAFNLKHPRVSKLPAIGYLIRKWTEEPLIYKLILIALCCLGAVILGYDLSYYDWLPDEPLVVKSAIGYLDSGSFTRWDFWMDELGTEKYERAWPHTWLVAQSINLFGLSEWSARFVSLVFGLFFIVVTYGVSSFFFKSRLTAVIVTFACITNPLFIVYFRRVRMYALLVPIFMLLYFMMYRILTTEKYQPAVLYNNRKWARKYLNYDWILVIGTLVLLYFSIEIHKLSFVIFPLLLPLFLYLLIVKKQIRLVIPLILGGLGLFLLGGEDIGKMLEGQFVFFEVYKSSYFKDFLAFPFPQSFSLAILTIGVLIFVFSKLKTELFALYVLLGTSILFYVYLINFPSHFRYVIHLLPFSYMLLIGLLMKVNQMFEKNWQKAIIPILIVILSIGNYTKQYEWMYKKYPEAQFASQAYPTITNNIQPQSEGIISLMMSDMYLKGLGKTIRRIEMTKNREYTVQQFQADVQKFENGAWVTWATHKTYHLRRDVIEYISRNCAKYHGYGVDDTLVEVFICR